MHKPQVGRSDKAPIYWFATCNRGCCREDVDVRFDDYAEALRYAHHLVDLAEDGPADNPLTHHLDPAWAYARDWQTHRETRS